MIGHRAPRVIGRRRLWEPDVARVTGELPAFQRLDDRIAIAQFATRRIDQIRTPLEVRQRLRIDHVLSFRIERTMQRDHIAGLGQTFQAVVMRHVELFLDGFR